MGAETGSPTGPMARLRVAHLSPDAPAVDVCLAAHGTNAWSGPVLAKAGANTGLAYSQVTNYLDVEAIQYDVRIVAPASKDCATALGGLADITNLPALPEGGSVTVAAEGTVGGSEPFGLAPYIDEASVAFGKAKLRFIHASPGTPNVDVGIGGGAVFTPVFSDIAFGAAGDYVETAPLTHAEISAREHGALSDVISIKPAQLPAGAIATAFAIGEIGNDHAPLGVLVCIDNDPAAGLLATCAIAGGTPERARARIAHFSPDAPAVDVCLAESGSGSWKGPLLRNLGAQGGLAYPQVTTYVDLPPGSYDARIVAGNAQNCGNGIVPDTIGVTVEANTTSTIAAIGVVDRTGHAANDPAFRLAAFADETAVDAGMTKLRFVHASPGTPAVDVGLGSAHLFTRVFANVSFGTVSASYRNGFVQTSPYQGQVSARLADQAYDALTIQARFEPNTIATAFAIGGKTGAITNPLQVLVCIDNAPVTSLLSTCAIP